MFYSVENCSQIGWTDLFNVINLGFLFKIKDEM